MKLIYLASPYSHEKEEIMQYRYDVICQLKADYMNKYKNEYAFYSPISTFHPIAKQHKLPTDWSFWLAQCVTILSKCDEMWVVRMDGWDKSKGVSEEIKIAKELKIITRHIILCQN